MNSSTDSPTNSDADSGADSDLRTSSSTAFSRTIDSGADNRWRYRRLMLYNQLSPLKEYTNHDSIYSQSQGAVYRLACSRPSLADVQGRRQKGHVCELRRVLTARPDRPLRALP